MGMSERVSRLRQESLEAVERLSTERAELLTRFYREHEELVSAPVKRAQAFHYVLAHKTIYIGHGELIVGEKGPAPKATPTYPELCCHSLQDLEILDSRAKIPFAVSPAARQAYEREIIPFWQGKTMREAIFAHMSDDWKAAYEAGIFTEFMEQRSPGHTVLDGKIYRLGMRDFQAAIQERIDRLDWLHDPAAYARGEELRAMGIAAEAIIVFAARHAARARELAAQETRPQRRAELEQIAAVCDRVPAHAPRTFWEALQAYWFVHLGVTTELNPWDSFSPGRLDQHLYPFYEADRTAGRLTREDAEELLQCLWIKFNNQPAPPKVGVTAAESGTYTDFCQINSGGVRPDGTDGVNPLTYLVLDVVQEMRLLQPSASIQVSRENPDELIRRAARIIRTGFGQPSVFNADMVARELVRQGKTWADARDGGTSGCVESGAFGKENYNLTGYFNLPKVLELALHDGRDPRTGRQLGPRTGDPAAFEGFEDLMAAFEAQVRHFVDVKVAGNNLIERLFAAHMPAPFLSLLISDCIERGQDYHDGGARYNTSYIQGVGLGTLTDTLAAIAYHVYEQRTLTMEALLAALDHDFEGHEPLRQRLLNAAPKYGNDDDRADALMVRAFETYYAAVEGRPNTRGGTYHVDMLPTTCHVYFGSVTGATADGRRAWQPLSEGISPVQGADRHGPTAVIKSVSKMDHERTGGTLLNQKFSPALLADEAGLDRLVQLIRAHFALGAHHIQFNVVDATTLRAAQANPAAYRDLIVRVAGYSDYFCDLSPALQQEIIARTEHHSLG